MPSAAATPAPASCPALFMAFLKIGATAFGGGIAALPVFDAEIHRTRGWLTADEVVENYAIAQSMPGVIIVNFAVLTGRQLAGWRGAGVAACAVVIPAFCVIWLFAALFGTRWDAPLLNGLLMGLRPAVIALLAVATWRLGRRALRNAVSLLLFAAGFAGFMLLHLPLPLLILAAAGIGLLQAFWSARKARAT